MVNGTVVLETLGLEGRWLGSGGRNKQGTLSEVLDFAFRELWYFVVAWGQGLIRDTET
jgi:hypothetical protein